jgi:hypothetical protein
MHGGSGGYKIGDFPDTIPLKPTGPLVPLTPQLPPALTPTDNYLIEILKELREIRDCLTIIKLKI